MEGPGPAGRQNVQQPQSPQSVCGLRLDVLDLRVRQDVLLDQERNDGVADQQLGGQIQSVSPENRSVDRVHVDDLTPLLPQ